LKIDAGGIDFSVSLQGSFRSFSIPDLLSLLHQHKKSGLLSLVSREDERGILFHRGNMVYATACDSPQRLGKFLIELGYVSEKDVAEASQRSTEGSRWGVEFLGQELLNRGALKTDQLNEAVREQIFDILDEVLLWEEGAFHFEEHTVENPGDLPCGQLIPTPSILLEAIRRFDECQLIRESFSDLSAVLEADAQAGLQSRQATLEAPARAILSLVDGKRTVAKVLGESDHSPYETSLILATLLKEKLVRAAAPRARSDELSAILEPWAMPVSPDLPSRISWVLRTAEKPVARIAEIVSREPTLAAKVMRHFAAARIDDAPRDFSLTRVVGAMGDLRLHALLLPEMVRGLYFAEKEFYWKDCRQHSVLCAHLCEEIANWVNYPRPEEAYLAGLLHNLGVFILLGVYRDRYRKVLDEARRLRRDLRALEEVTFGNSHVKIGALYAQRWRFPQGIVQAIKLHHAPGGELPDLLCILTIANWIARNYNVGVESHPNSITQVDQALGRFSLTKKKVLALSENAVKEGLLVSENMAPGEYA